MSSYWVDAMSKGRKWKVHTRQTGSQVLSMLQAIEIKFGRHPEFCKVQGSHETSFVSLLVQLKNDIKPPQKWLTQMEIIVARGSAIFS